MRSTACCCCCCASVATKLAHLRLMINAKPGPAWRSCQPPPDCFFRFIFFNQSPSPSLPAVAILFLRHLPPLYPGLTELFLVRSSFYLALHSLTQSCLVLLDSRIGFGRLTRFFTCNLLCFTWPFLEFNLVFMGAGCVKLPSIT